MKKTPRNHRQSGEYEKKSPILYQKKLPLQLFLTKFFNYAKDEDPFRCKEEI